MKKGPRTIADRKAAKGGRPMANREAAKAGRPMTKRQLSRHERDMRLQRIAKTAFGVLLVVIALVVAFGYWREMLAPGGEAILRVRGVPISTQVYAKMLGYQQYQLDLQVANLQSLAARSTGQDENAALMQQFVQQQVQQLQQQRASLDGQTLEQLVDDQLIAQEAARRGIQVTDSEVDAAILEEYTPSTGQAAADAGEGATAATTPEPASTPVPTPAPTATPVTQEQALEKKRKELGNLGLLLESEYRDLIVKPSILRDRLQKALGDAVPTTADQVWARHILVDSEEQAKDVLSKLQGGADFAALAGELSVDPGSKDKGGDLGWFPRKAMVAEFEEAAFGLQVGQTVSAPVKTSYGYHVIQSLGKEQNRPLAEDQLTVAKSSALDNWLLSQRGDDPGAIDYEYSSTKVNWARNWIAKNAKYLQAPKR